VETEVMTIADITRLQRDDTERLERAQARLTQARQAHAHIQSRYGDDQGATATAVRAQQDAEARAQRLAERKRLQQEEARWASTATPLMELSRLLDGLTAAALIAAGYHQHHRGAWGKRRHGTQG
jgi:hypothetical protein